MFKQVHRGTSPTDTALDVQSVTKVYEQWQRSGTVRNILHNLLRPQKKTVYALKDVSFRVQKGEFVAYAGPNGAGKSTTIKLLCGMLAQNSGEILTLGMPPLSRRIELMRRTGILFGNRTELWWDHPVSTSFRWKKTVWNIPTGDFRSMEKTVLDLLDIAPFYHTFARELSLGQRMRADLGMMLLHRPELILLDEPTLGLDVLAKRQMIEFLKLLNRNEGTTVIVTSHDMDDLEEMARRILLLCRGQLAFDGDFSALRRYIGCARRATVTLQGGTQKVLPYDDTEKLLGELSATAGVTDVTLSQDSLEEALARLYTSWSQES